MHKYLKSFFIVLGLIIVVYGLFFADTWIKGNFHVVTKNEAYRSGQLDKNLLKYYVKKYGIKSVINLRGAEPGKDWYDDEIEVCSKYGINHYDLDMAMDKEPTDEQIKILIGFFKTAPRPVFIHCLGGSDRTGLASTLWKIVIDKQDKKTAAKHMLFYYGHIPFGKAGVLDKWLWSTEISLDGKIIKKETTEYKLAS
ncbi:dual specificity protein phosphatase family protein [Candidatus Ruminimicrobiellum ovillum]|uniref:dual specificity protein phosphatase family protein n=1 Tax=Candidatus Ruminimicrobiellum ovillum TaxID=1947927 RepID=UPI00355A77C0